DHFTCPLGGSCFPNQWICDGHPDCSDDWDEQDCGTAAPSPAGSAGQGSEWGSASALSSPGLLSILVAAGSVVVWDLSKAKGRSNTFSLEKASREQLMPDKSQ
ncbi:RSVR protein, partial [Serilophus lunatus]|nr:RSVR protein [Serilophus lunatus]